MRASQSPAPSRPSPATAPCSGDGWRLLPIGWCPGPGDPGPTPGECAWLRVQGLGVQGVLLRLEDAPAHAGIVLAPGVHRIGRDAGCDWVIPLRCVSRRHVEVEVLPTRGVVIRDLASTNGTWIDDRPLLEAAVEHAVVLGIGPLRLLLCPATQARGGTVDSVAQAQVADPAVQR